MNQNKTKRILCVLLSCVVLGGGVLALEAGDSLISKSYFQSAYEPDMLTQGRAAADKVVQDTVDTAITQLDQITAELQANLAKDSGGLVSASLTTQDYGQGDRVTLGAGSTVLVTVGTISITHDGTAIDVTEGTEILSGSRLQKGHRYIVDEETSAVLEVLSGYGTLAYQGSYAFDAGTGKNHPFLDVTSEDSYNEAVSFVYNNNLFAGMGDGTFGATAPMDRSMVMTVFYHLAGDPTDELASSTMTFDDVPANAWFVPYVSWGATKGVTAGTGAGQFSPKMAVTQEQMVQLLYNFASNYMGFSLTGETDLSVVETTGAVSGWAETAMGWAVAQGVVDAPLKPKDSVTRAEVATMLMNFSLIYLK